MTNQHNKTTSRSAASRGARGLTVVFCFLFFTGCASIVKMPDIDTSFLKPPGPVTSVVASWGPAISNGENPQRGFGGRVYFHDQDLRPVKIKGTVIVYIFDEDGRSPGDAKPNEGIVFDEKTLNSKGVYAKSSLGHSYNLWVPVDIAGPESPAKRISLIVRYIPNHGVPQMSSQSTVLLPGRRGQEMLPGEADWEIRSETHVAQPASERLRLSDRPQSMQAVTIW